jgi:hypothetical protein
MFKNNHPHVHDSARQGPSVLYSTPHVLVADLSIYTDFSTNSGRPLSAVPLEECKTATNIWTPPIQRLVCVLNIVVRKHFEGNDQLSLSDKCTKQSKGISIKEYHKSLCSLQQ